MSSTPFCSQDIEEAITKALKKIGSTRESDLCRYLPGDDGRYIHHFTMKKMKQRQPKQLLEMLEKNIFSKDKPSRLQHRQRAPRGSRKRLELMNLTRQDMDKVILALRQTGDKDIVKKLSPKRDLKTLKRELGLSIKQGRIEHELWNAYVDALTALQAQTAMLLDR